MDAGEQPGKGSFGRIVAWVRELFFIFHIIK
jgi:hypothetical protein